MYSSPASFRRPVPAIDDTRPVSSAYSARALFEVAGRRAREVRRVEHGRAPGRSCVLKPERRRSARSSSSSIQLVRRVKEPPNVKLWVPFSQFNWSSMFQFGVLRGCRAVGVARAPRWSGRSRGQRVSRCSRAWLSNIAGVAVGEEVDRRPLPAAAHLVDESSTSVDRSELDPVVRYDVLAACAGKPGNVGSALFSVSGRR